MDKREALLKLAEYKKLLSKHLAFEQMVLFGSYAQDSQREGSDVDVAIIVDEISGDFWPLLWRIRREVDDRIEPILFESKHDNSGFLKEILTTGILI